MHNQTVRCAVSNTSFVVKQMDSPRMMHKGGQFVFFCCNNCWMSFWKSPGKYILDSGINANAVEKIGLGGLKRADANTLPVVLISVVATLCIAICSHAITSKRCLLWELTLEKNSIGEDGMRELVNALVMNLRMQKLVLMGNAFVNVGAAALENMLESNGSL